MPYGTVKVDNITFDQGGADQNVTASGIYRAITSGVTVTGTISGATASFTSGNFVSATFTSTAIIASGTAASPSLAILSDPNTGLYSPGADQVALATAGTGRLFVDASGNINLGQSSSALQSAGTGLTIYGSANSEIKFLNSTTGATATDGTALVSDSVNFSINNREAGNIIFGTSNAERMRLDSSGKLGIGTSSPDAQLRVFGNAKIGEGVASPTGKLIVNTISGQAASLQLFQDGNESWIIENPASSTALTFANSGAERMRLDGSGNIGISQSSITPVFGRTVSATLAGTGATYRVAGTSTSAYFFTSDGSGYGGLLQETNHPLIFGTNSAERMRLDASGRLGVGTSTPSAPIEIAAASSAGASTVARLRHDNGADQHYFDITVNADTDTVKLISSGSANGSIILGTQAVDALTTTSAGNVGIGTTSPQNTFVVSNAGAEGIEFVPSASGAIIGFNRGTAAYSPLTLNSSVQIFQTSGTERMRLTAAGLLGLGTSSPESLLHVLGEIKGGSTSSINGTTILSDFYTSGTSLGSLGIERSSGALVLTTNVKQAENATGYVSANTLNIGKAALKLGSTGLFYATASASVVPTGNSVSLTDRFVITNAGLVGIGTSSPGSMVDINDPGTGLRFQNASSGNFNIGLLGGTSSTEAYVFQRANASLIFGTNNTERLRIDSSGNVGIGTSSPATLFHAYSGAIDEVARFEGTGSPYVSIYDTGVRQVYISVGSQVDFLVEVNKPLVFSTNNTERARIDSSGNVGIGTSSPAVNLEVASATPTVRISATGGGTPALSLFSAGVYNWLLQGGTALTFTQDATERARIDTSGRLLVGTSSDSGGALLQVNGDRVRIATAKTPASASDTGVAGEICWDASYVYVCTATNTWKRTAISTW